MRDTGGRGAAKKKSDASLPESDVRAIVSLLGEVAASRKDHAGMKRQLMDGLCDLVNADAWIWALGCQMEGGKQPVYTSFLHGGFSEERFAKYCTAIEHPDMNWLSEPILRELQSRKSHLTRLRQQMDRENLFLKADVFRLWSAADIAQIILSLRPLQGDSVGCMALYRSKDKPLFNERESLLAHIVLSEVPWLHDLGWPVDRGATVPRLSPRLRLVLNLLLDGLSRKQISAHLAISENTVSGYQKEIYRHFRVNSHAELMRKFQQGDGGDA